MNIDKKHWISNGSELVQSGDFVRLISENGEWSEWGSADHLAGSRVDSFVQWHGMGVQFARVPTATAKQPRNLADAIQRWQQESTPVPEGSEWLTDPTETIQRGDLYRVREDSHSDYCDWRPADLYEGTEVGYFNAWHRRDVQFCRPAKSAPEPQWEMVSDRDYILRPGIDQVRCRTYLDESGHWGPWIAWHTIEAVQTVGGFIGGPGGTAAAQEWQFRRRVAGTQPAADQPAPEQPPTPTTDRGERYRRTITQSLPGDTIGLSITVDLADVLDAFGVPYMLAQAVKKAVLPGERGSKDRLKDLREAAWHIQRQIQIEEARQQEQADL